MFLPVNNFFLTTVNHWPLVRVTEVATKTLDDIASGWIMVTAFWALIAFGRCGELTFEPALEALIDWRVGAEIADLVIRIVPNGFQCLWVLLQVRVFTIMDEATGTVLRIILFKIKFLKWSW